MRHSTLPAFHSTLPTLCINACEISIQGGVTPQLSHLSQGFPGQRGNRWKYVPVVVGVLGFGLSQHFFLIMNSVMSSHARLWTLLFNIDAAVHSVAIHAIISKTLQFYWTIAAADWRAEQQVLVDIKCQKVRSSVDLHALLTTDGTRDSTMHDMNFLIKKSFLRVGAPTYRYLLLLYLNTSNLPERVCASKVGSWSADVLFFLDRGAIKFQGNICPLV